METVDRILAMKEIIDWLAGVEKRASILYSQAALAFTGDKEFATFLEHLAEEETEHFELLSRATGGLVQEKLAESCFSLDEAIRQTVEIPFDRAHAKLAKGSLTKAAMLGIIAEAEFSEWNDIFLYVMDALKGHGREFQRAVAEIDQHRIDIQTFIASFPWGNRVLKKIGRLSPLWKKRILVVEDDLAIANLIKSLLRAEAEVVIARDGKQGLESIRQGHFNVVVSDVEMPNLNGIELYKQALAVDPDLKKHFVFFTGTRKPEYHQFFEVADVVMLPKPSPLSLLRKTINELAEVAG